MEIHRILVKHILARIVLVCALLPLTGATSLPAFAYDQKETHPALTRAMGELFNKQRGNALTSSDLQALARGSVDEDKPFRFLNHFYDPIHNRGLWGLYASSKQWAQNPLAQVGPLNSTARHIFNLL